jgi:hypothetical protein
MLSGNDIMIIVYYLVFNCCACLLKTPCAISDEPIDDIKEMQKQLSELVDGIDHMEAKVDNTNIDVSDARVQSPLFKGKVAEGNPFDTPEIGFPTPAGKFLASADGYWVLLAPNALKPGPHDISVKGFVPLGPGIPDFVIDVSYRVNIK